MGRFLNSFDKISTHIQGLCLYWFTAKATPDGFYAIDTYLVAVCDNIRISRCRLYQGEEWRGK